MDSLTRFALAQREIGLAAGEPPTSRGFTPSVFALLPKLVERAGRSPQGSITAFYAVLVEADDPNEPISDAVRGLLDGHTWLSRKLSARGHYPAVDVLESVSRLLPEVTDDEHRPAIYAVRDLLGVYRDHEDLISIGAYRRGSNQTVDAAIDMQDEINRYLRQPVEQPSTLAEARQQLLQLYELLSPTTGGRLNTRGNVHVPFPNGDFAAAPRSHAGRTPRRNWPNRNGPTRNFSTDWRSFGPQQERLQRRVP